MSHRLLDRMWNRIVDRYDGQDGGDCGCGAALDEGDGGARVSEPDAVESSKRESER